MADNPAFLDSNILCYLFGTDPAKADRASELLADAPTISVQVLAEMCHVASRKAKMSWAEIEEVMEVVTNVCNVVPLTAAIQAHARRLAARTGYTIYDAQILAAAAASGCATVWSEDLHDGHIVTDSDLPLVIRNPFAR